MYCEVTNSMVALLSVVSWHNALPLATQVSSRLVMLMVFASLFLINKLMTPSLDPQEPPLRKPTIPWIGHIIGLMQNSAEYLTIIGYYTLSQTVSIIVAMSNAEN